MTTNVVNALLILVWLLAVLVMLEVADRLAKRRRSRHSDAMDALRRIGRRLR